MGEIEFHTKLIQSKTKKLSNSFISIISIFIFLVLTVVVLNLQDGKHKVFLDILRWFILFIGYLIHHYWNYSYKVIGNLSCNNLGVEISDEKGSKLIAWDEISNLALSRGSTYHYFYQIANSFKANSNFIQFSAHGQNYQFEFLIDSKETNKAFENMLDNLYVNQWPVSYKSV